MTAELKEGAPASQTGTVSCVAANGDTAANVQCDFREIKVFTGKRRWTRSPRGKVLADIRDRVYGYLTIAGVVTESDLIKLCPRYTNDGLRAMRQVHSRFPRITVLQLEGGLWTLRMVNWP